MSSSGVQLESVVDVEKTNQVGNERKNNFILFSSSKSNRRRRNINPNVLKKGIGKENLDRAVSKDGICNFEPGNVKQQNRKFLADICTTLLEIRWRWTLAAFCTAYFGSWLIFAILWYLILFLHGDIDHFGEEGWRPCVTGIQNFTSAFLFSVETQHTTGYGFYELTELCPEGVFLFCMQSIVGVILEGMMVGLVFAKLSRPKKRSETIMFSKNAVICKRDGILCFMFRIADMRKTHLLEAHVRAQLVKKKRTGEGETITLLREELEVKGEGEKDDNVLLFWPTTVIHEITQNSPLKDLAERDFGTRHDEKGEENEKRFEIIVVLEGILESTGLTVQARSSYLPDEILWGKRFEELQLTKTSSGQRIINYSLFDKTVSSDM